MFRTPVDIPQGSVVTEVTFTYRNAVDANTTHLDVMLTTIEPVGANQAVGTGGDSTGPGNGTVSTTLNPPLTIHAGQALHLTARLDATSSVCGAQVTYQPPGSPAIAP